MNLNFKILFLLFLMTLLLIPSGCLDSKSEDKYVTLVISSGFYMADKDTVPSRDDENYKQYDEHIFVEIVNLDELNYPGFDGSDKHVEVEITSFDITQSTKYTMKSSGTVRFNCFPCSETMEFEPSLIMIVRDYKGNIIAMESTEIKMLNGESVPFTIQAIIN